MLIVAEPQTVHYNIANVLNALCRSIYINNNNIGHESDQF